MRILIVDDNPIACIMIRDMLGARGHEVVAEANTPADALAAYNTHKPDLVTLDLSLGTESGLSVLQAILKVNPQAKIVVISGNSQRGIQEKVLEQGAAAFVQKPFRIDDLNNAVQGTVKHEAK